MTDTIIKVMTALDTNTIIFALTGIFIGALPSLINSTKIRIENNRLKKEIHKLTKSNLYFTYFSLKSDGVYYNQNGLPFCAACCAKGHKVPPRKKLDSENGVYECPVFASCNAFYYPRYAKQEA